MPRGRNRKPPHIVQRDGVYYVLYYDEEAGRSNRQSLRTSDMDEAQSRFEGWLDARKKLKAAEEVCDFSTAFEFYFAQHIKPNKSDKSIETVMCHKKALGSFFGDVALPDIDRALVYQYIDARESGKINGRKIKGGTIRRELTTLQSVINFMVKRVEPRKYRIAPTDVIAAMPKPADSPPRERVLTLDELNKLREECSIKPGKVLQRIHVAIWLLMETGARQGALRSLKWSQVNLDEGYIKLLPAGLSQNNKRRPTVPISDALLPVLEHQRKLARSPYVLLHSGSIRKSFDSLMRRLNIDGVTPHTFRHTFATRLVQNGVSIPEVSALTGDSAKTLHDKYIHLSPQFLRNAISSLSSGLNAPQHG